MEHEAKLYTFVSLIFRSPNLPTKWPWPPLPPWRIPNVKISLPSWKTLAVECLPPVTVAPNFPAIARASRFWIRLRDKVLPQYLKLPFRQRSQLLLPLEQFV